MTITEPGIYPGITDTEYHADPVVGGSLTSTGARTLINRTPAHYRHEQKQGRPDKAAFDLGRAVHDALLGHGAPLHEVPADDWRTKAAKEARDWAREQGYTPLLTPQIEAVRAVVAAVRSDSTAGRLFARDGQAELTVVARDPETGVMCRARLDWYVPGAVPLFVDLKTCEDASARGLARAMSNWNYHQQLPFYEDTLRAATGHTGPIRTVLVGVEKEPPHLVGFGEPDEQAIAWGRRLNRKARDIYRRCRDTDTWPGHEPRPVPLSLPGWQLNAYETADALGHYDIEGDWS